MSLPHGSRVAVVGWCSDPRFSINPGQRFLQFRQALNVDYIVPLAKPGFIGLYAPNAHARVNSNNGNGHEHGVMIPPRRFEEHRLAWEEDFLIHWGFHHPCVVGVSGHETCGGFPVEPIEQCRAAFEAADMIRRRLQANYNINITVVPLVEERITDSDWRVNLLTNELPETSPFPSALPLPQFA